MQSIIVDNILSGKRKRIPLNSCWDLQNLLSFPITNRISKPPNQANQRGLLPWPVLTQGRGEEKRRRRARARHQNCKSRNASLSSFHASRPTLQVGKHFVFRDSLSLSHIWGTLRFHNDSLSLSLIFFQGIHFHFLTFVKHCIFTVIHFHFLTFGKHFVFTVIDLHFLKIQKKCFLSD